MPTTKSNIVKILAPGLVGSTVQSANALVAFDGAAAAKIGAAYGIPCDKVSQDLSTMGLAKNGGNRLSLSGTTPVNIDLTDLTANAASSAGDTSFASFVNLTLYNDGAAAVTVAPGASNPASIGLSGTSPTLTVNPGCACVLNYGSPVTVDSTHKIITVTPTSGGSFVLSVGGA